jgi:hypothetical protein
LLEPTSLRFLTAAVAFVSLTLSTWIIPLFPAPLPMMLAFLVSFGIFLKPQYAMPVGGFMVGLSIVYQLSAMNFIAVLGAPVVRGVFVAVLLYLFTALPLRFHSCEDIIAINFGILGASLLFFGQTYIFAIPLLLTVAILFKKEQGVLSLAFYGLISVPLQILQFSDIIRTITRTEWWLDPKGVPPLYVPLTGVFNRMQDSMTQFRLFDTSKVVNVMSNQLTISPPDSAAWVGKALSQYLDSFPGIFLFLTLVLCLIFAISTIAPEFTRKSFSMRMEILLPALSAAGITALFFIFALAMQEPMAFRAQLTNAQVAYAVFATIFIALPISYIHYGPKKRRLIEERSVRVVAKSSELAAKLAEFQALLTKAKTVPADVKVPEGKFHLIQDTLNDIIAKTAAKHYDPSELDEKFREMRDKMSVDIDSLKPELAKDMEQYQLQVNYDYATWLKRLREIGFEAKNPAKANFQKDMSIEARVDNIQELLNSSRALATEVSLNVELTYSIIRALYDQDLPPQSRTVLFVKQQLKDTMTPWFATDALFTSLTNWKAIYGKDVAKTVQYVLGTLDAFTGLDAQKEALQTTLGKQYARIVACLAKVEELKRVLKNRAVSVADLPFIKSVVEASLSLSNEVLSALHELMQSKEATIENLLPIRESFWEKNALLKDQIAEAIAVIADASKQPLNKTMAELPKALMKIHECIQTLQVYTEKEELLLNYPVAKTAIDELFKQRKRVSARDLPFDARYAEEYLRLYYTSQAAHNAFSYDETTLTLSKKP